MKPLTSLEPGVGLPSSQPAGWSRVGVIQNPHTSALKQCSDQTDTEIPLELTLAASRGGPREAVCSEERAVQGIPSIFSGSRDCLALTAHSEPFWPFPPFLLLPATWDIPLPPSRLEILADSPMGANCKRLGISSHFSQG